MKTLYHPRSILLPVLFFGLISCGKAAAPPTATPTPSATPTLTATATATATATPEFHPGNSQRTVEVDGTERTYLLHVPPDADPETPIPLVFVFHGWSGLPDGIQGTTDFDDISDQNGFLAVYPRGSGTGNTDLSWNAGICCGYALDHGVDDIAFVNAMLEDLGTIAVIDPQRTYATGFSNGAFLSYRLACEMSETFAAVAPVGGTLVFQPCEPKQPVALLAVHGLYDMTVPYEGGGDLIDNGFPPVTGSIQTWVGLNGCTGEPQVDEPYKNVVRTVYGDCRAGTAVELYTVDFFGHTWPLINTFPASETIWEFFTAHPRQ